MGLGAFGAQDLGSWPSPFVTSAGSNILTVVGGSAAPGDVVGAIDVAASLGVQEAVQTGVAGSGSSGGTAVDLTGEGKEVGTGTTKIFLDDSLGKTGLRTSMTKDELPVTLKSEVHTNTDGDHKYTQVVKLTPGSTTSASYTMQFEKPGSDSSKDPTYSFGRFLTSPSITDYLYTTEVSFDTTVNLSSAKGEVLRLFGEDFYVHADTTADPAPDGNDNKLVLFKGEKVSLKGGESQKVTVGGKEYTVTLNGLTAASTASVSVDGSAGENIDKGKTRKIGSIIEVFVSSASQLSTTDQAQNTAGLVVGTSDSKLELNHGDKLKVGSQATSKDGTLINLTISSRKLSKITTYAGGRRSSEDYLKLGTDYEDPVWAFKLAFPSVSIPLGDAARNPLKIAGAGDNVMQVTFTDDRGNTKTADYAYKDAAAATTATLADASNNSIVVVENRSVAKDAYFTFQSGDSTALLKLTSLSASQSTSDGFSLLDVAAGTTTTYTTGSSDGGSFNFRGQTFYAYINSTHGRFTWGTGADVNKTGTYISVFSPIKLKNGEYLSFVPGTSGNPVVQTTQINTFSILTNKTFINLPTGAINISTTRYGSVAGGTTEFNITAVSKEDGTASALAAVVSANLSNFADNTANVNFTLGRTSTGGLSYNILIEGDTNLTPEQRNVSIRIVGPDATGPAANVSLLLVEEKDDASNQYSIKFPTSMELSGSNQQIVPGTPEWTATEDTVTLGSVTTDTATVDLWGTHNVLHTSGRDNLELWYPNDQVYARAYVLAKAASISSVAGSAAVLASSAVSTEAVAKLDTEISKADLESKNLLVVGGPAVNKLAADLLGKAFPTYGEASGVPKDQALLQLFENPTLDLYENAKGKVALLVAGWEAAHTRVATTLLQQYNSAANKGKLKGAKVVLDATGAVVAAAASPAASPAAS